MKHLNRCTRGKSTNAISRYIMTHFWEPISSCTSHGSCRYDLVTFLAPIANRVRFEKRNKGQAERKTLSDFDSAQFREQRKRNPSKDLSRINFHFRSAFAISKSRKKSKLEANSILNKFYKLNKARKRLTFTSSWFQLVLMKCRENHPTAQKLLSSVSPQAIHAGSQW